MKKTLTGTGLTKEQIRKNVNSNLRGKQEDYSLLYWSVKFMHFPYKCIL